jgi:hypothetical protein
MKPLIWKLWLTDRTVEGKTLADWENVPSNNFIAAIEYFGKNEFENKLYRINMGCDWYWMINDEIHSSGSSHDVPGEFFENPAPEGSSVKSGIWVSNEMMNEIATEIENIVHGTIIWPVDIS